MVFVSRFPRYCCLLLLAVSLRAQDTGGSGVITYDGPEILGRNGPWPGTHGREAVPIHVQASLNGTYDSSLMGYYLDPSGNLVTKSSEGVEAFWGASGRKSWRKQFLGIDYGGNYNHYNVSSYYNGSNHQLNMVFGSRIGRAAQFFSQVAAGTSNRFIGGPMVFQSTGLEFLSAPTMEQFDARSYFIGTTTGLIYNLTNRHSIRFTGNGSTVRRKAAGLVDMVQYGAAADWVYRINRRTSIGVSYVFTHYDYMKVFGESNVHTLGWHLSRRINRDWEFAMSLTGNKQSTQGIRSFALDPVLSAILGRSTGTEVFSSNNLLYGFSGNIIRRIRHSTGRLTAQRGINAGNGYFLTSINESAELNFTHNFSRDFAVSGFVSYNRLTSLGFAAGAYRGWTNGASVTRKLTDSFGVNARYDYRTFDYQTSSYGRTGHRVTAGITYFPSRGPAGLW